MNATQFIQDILACPFCKTSLALAVDSQDYLGILDGSLTCPECKRVYGIEHGIVDLRVDIPRNYKETEWQLAPFEDRYSNLGLYKNSWEWGELTGIPNEVTSYMYPKVKGRLLELLVPKKDEIILDVGCGVGYFLFEIMYKNSEDIILMGIDVARPNLELFRKRCLEEGKSMTCIIADAQHLPIKSNAIDHITCTEVLEHIYNPRTAITEMARSLKCGGKLLISTPLAEAEKRWKILSSPFRYCKRALQNKTKQNTLKPESGYDSPLTSDELRNFIQSVSLDLQLFERNVILPPEGYFKALPNSVVKMVVKICSIFERYFKNTFAPLAMHAVVIAQKQAQTITE